MISTPQLLEAFVEMADTLVDDFDLQDFLHGVAVRAEQAGGVAAVGIVLHDVTGALRAVAVSHETGPLADLLQERGPGTVGPGGPGGSGGPGGPGGPGGSPGPAHDVLATGEPVVETDLATADGRWPVFAPAATAAGFGALLAVPMRLRQEVIGVLHLLGHPGTRVSPDEQRVVQALADVATIAILQERGIARADALAAQLQQALDSRVLIEQAKGALAQAARTTPAEAFESMRRRARAGRTTLSAVAAAVLAELGTGRA